MRIRFMAGLAIAGVLLAGCSSTSSGGSAAADTSAATSPGTADVAPASGSSTSGQSSDNSGAASSSSSAPSSDGSSSAAAGAGKPVAALLAKASLPAAGRGGAVFGADMPKAEPAWIAAVATTESDGSALKAAPLGSVALNLAALVDEAAKTQDLDSLRKLCWNGCVQLSTLMPAKDASGRTGFQRLSQLLEKTHPAMGNTGSWSVDYPGFSATQHGPATTLDRQDMKLLGGAARYTGMRTGIELANDGMNPTMGWNAVLDPSA